MTLDQLKPGQSAIVVRLIKSSDNDLKLASLGMLPGDSIEILSKAPFGGPISIKHGKESFFALRKHEASNIEVNL